jgi:putative acetyltransferase
VEIRAEEARDEERVDRLHRAAFGDQGDMVVALLRGLRREATREDALSLVAVDAGQVVGHVLFSRGLLDAPPRLVRVQVLSPVAVLPKRQGEGIGSMLVRRGLEESDQRAEPLVFLEGAPSFYSRLGFERADALGFRKPSLRIPDAAFQVVRLSSYEPWMTGTLVYSQTFWEHDAVGLRDDEAVSRQVRSDAGP